MVTALSLRQYFEAICQENIILNQFDFFAAVVVIYTENNFILWTDVALLQLLHKLANEHVLYKSTRY